MDISVITPSCRIEALEMVRRCLQKHNFTKENWEWIIVSPFVPFPPTTEAIENQKTRARLQGYAMVSHVPFSIRWIPAPPKRKNDFYVLNQAYNRALRVANGDLIISYQDGIWTDSNMLQHFWDLYQDNPRSCVGAVGDQYEKLDEFGKPTIVCWRDPRRTDKHGEYYEINPVDLEWTLASIPRKALFDAGGLDEGVYDKFVALSEKELNARMDKLGYKFFLDQGLSYLAIRHERLGENGEWDKRYFEGCEIYQKHLQEIQEGKRLKLNYL